MNATTMLRLLGVRPDLLTKAVEMLLEKTPDAGYFDVEAMNRAVTVILEKEEIIA